MKSNTAHNWKEIDPLLLKACLALTPTDREKLLGRLIERFGMRRETLIKRLDFLGATFPPKCSSRRALEVYKQQMLVAIQGYRIYMRLRYMLMTNLDQLNAQARQRPIVHRQEHSLGA